MNIFCLCKFNNYIYVMKNTFKLLSLTISLIVGDFSQTTLRADLIHLGSMRSCPQNNASIADEDGDHSDWIEILNTTDDSASIGRYDYQIQTLINLNGFS